MWSSSAEEVLIDALAAERDEAIAAEARWLGRADKALAERDEAREALKAAHHALTTVHGLWATDKKPNEEDTEVWFRIDKLKVLAMIEALLD